jgi:hypothetical protein
MQKIVKVPVSDQPNRKPYQRPFVVYSSKISTRAGSPASAPGDTAVDPADLFGN